MPLSTANLTASMGWTLTKSNSPFQNSTEGPDSQSFTLTGLNTSTFNQLYAAQFTLAASASQTIDCTSLTNLVGESFSFGHVLSVLVLPTGSQCTFSPGASNALTWFFSGTSPAAVIPAGGMFCYSEPVAGPGNVVDSTHKNLKLLNSGGTSLTVSIALLGSTT